MLVSPSVVADTAVKVVVVVVVVVLVEEEEVVSDSSGSSRCCGRTYACPSRMKKWPVAKSRACTSPASASDGMSASTSVVMRRPPWPMTIEPPPTIMKGTGMCSRMVRTLALSSGIGTLTIRPGGSILLTFVLMKRKR